MSRRRSQRVTVLVDDGDWRDLAPRPSSQVRKAAALALARVEASKVRADNMTVLLTNDEHIRALNAQFRREAESDGKTLMDHVTHLTVHGILHLLGYDHEKPHEAEIMEALETDILAELAIPDPYARRKRAA